MLKILKKSKNTIKILLVFVFCIIAIYFLFFPQKTLEEQLFSRIDKRCNLNCTILLHDITPFKWDKAYFFCCKTPGNVIQQITNTDYAFDTDINTEQKIIFIKNNKIIFYEPLFECVDLMIPWQIPSTAIYIQFTLSKEELSQLHYTGNLSQKKDFINISYYEIKPENDQLKFNFFLNKRLHQKVYIISPSNLKQVSLIHS